ncbi:unnamed protein product [Arctogadus glacialis]
MLPYNQPINHTHRSPDRFLHSVLSSTVPTNCPSGRRLTHQLTMYMIHSRQRLIPRSDFAEVTAGLHGYNAMLVSLLMGRFSSAGDWYWWLLLPACLGAAACTFLYSGLSPVLDRWDLPVAVFPFNIVIVLYIAVGALQANATELNTAQLLQGIFLGVGQIFACDSLGPSLLILGATLLYSPLQALHAVLGSAAGTLADKQGEGTDCSVGPGVSSPGVSSPGVSSPGVSSVGPGVSSVGPGVSSVTADSGFSTGSAARGASNSSADHPTGRVLTRAVLGSQAEIVRAIGGINDRLDRLINVLSDISASINTLVSK